MKLEIFAEARSGRQCAAPFHRPALRSDCSSRLIFSLERLTDSLYFPFENRGFSVLSDLISVFFGTRLCYNF